MFSSLRGCISLGLILATTLIAAQEPPRSVWQGVYTAVQSERGRSVYQASCGTCHGETLGGDIGPTLTGPF